MGKSKGKKGQSASTGKQGNRDIIMMEMGMGLGIDMDSRGYICARQAPRQGKDKARFQHLSV